MPEPEMTECRKCGAKWHPNYLRQKETMACLLCGEPLPDFIASERSDRGESEPHQG